MPSRERLYRTEAIVLRRSDWGEADRLLTLFTPELGKLRVLAKGVRRLRSRKAGHLELFTRSNLLVAKGRDLHIVTQAETVDAYRPARDDLLRTTYACYVAELVDQFTLDGAENRPLYNLLAQALGWVGSSHDLAATARYVELAVLDLVGYRPELFRCVRRGEAVQAEDQFFSVSEGGAVCPRCGPGQVAGVQPISMSALKFLRYFQTSPYLTAMAASVRPAVHVELERVMLRYLTHQLERRLKSVDFLRRVRLPVADSSEPVTAEA